VNIVIRRLLWAVGVLMCLTVICGPVMAHDWPLNPFTAQHSINGTLGEYREDLTLGASSVGVSAGVTQEGAAQFGCGEREISIEYKSPEPVADVIYGDGRMTVARARALGAEGLETRTVGDTVDVSYPKVVMITDPQASTNYVTYIKAIRFLDPDGNLKKEVAIQGQRSTPEQGHGYIILSGNCKYLAVNSPEPVGTDPKEPVAIRSVIYDTDGNEIWRLRHWKYAFEISPDGQYLIADGGDCAGCPVEVLTQTGSVAKIKKGETIDQGASGFQVSFAEDARFFVLVVETVDWSIRTDRFTDRLRAHVVAVDRTGHVLWRRDDIARGDACHPCRISISKNGVVTVVTAPSENKIYRFDGHGNPLPDVKPEE